MVKEKFNLCLSEEIKRMIPFGALCYEKKRAFNPFRKGLNILMVFYCLKDLIALIR
jgi:hypothetical protein